MIRLKGFTRNFSYCPYDKTDYEKDGKSYLRVRLFFCLVPCKTNCHHDHLTQHLLFQSTFFDKLWKNIDISSFSIRQSNAKENVRFVKYNRNKARITLYIDSYVWYRRNILCRKYSVSHYC